ncbi:MAG: hypothetical protein PHG66_04275 [Candidatus Colwellbacteria bacterium]|nr:hypothetical protein [Candidatus Colwellbacteria bacterium]
MKFQKEGILRKAVIIISIVIIPFVVGCLSRVVLAATNIDATYPNYYAWSDSIGWIDFLSTGTVDVEKDGLGGYAQFGPTGGPFNYISLDCATGPAGSSCSPVSYKVVNDYNGNLSGWAWSDVLGWISFDCHNPETGGASPNYSCTQSLYQVKIDNQGQFSGWAWSDTAGWISFNCNQVETGDGCSVSNYKVRSQWSPGPVKGNLESGTFDTKVTTGASFNYIVWSGQANGGRVSFQFASSNCENGATNAPTCDANIGWGSKASGDGAFIGPGGTSVDTDTYLSSGPGSPVSIVNQSTHNNRRYFRYKVFLETDASQSMTPIIEDIIVNWSP